MGLLSLVDINHIIKSIADTIVQEPHAAANVPRLNRPEDDCLEGTPIPQIAPKKSNSDVSKTTVNNAGVFHNPNLSHVNQGNYSTVNQGDVRIVVGGNMVQNVNEDGVFGAVLSWI